MPCQFPPQYFFSVTLHGCVFPPPTANRSVTTFYSLIRSNNWFTWYMLCVRHKSEFPEYTGVTRRVYVIATAGRRKESIRGIWEGGCGRCSFLPRRLGMNLWRYAGILDVRLSRTRLAFIHFLFFTWSVNACGIGIWQTCADVALVEIFHFRVWRGMCAGFAFF